MSVNLKAQVKHMLPPFVKGSLKKCIFSCKYIYWVFTSYYNKLTISDLLKRSHKIHLGCGEIKIDNFINVDIRATTATDIISDCTDLKFLPNSSVEYVFANAFLEHVYLSERQKTINEIYRVLKKGGTAAIFSIPDFEEISRSYLSKQKMTKRKLFDLHQAYRLTHGDPEQAPTWWLAQLHKTLFDKETLKKIFRNAGFQHMLIFRCCYDEDLLPLSLGIIAYKTGAKKRLDKKAMIENMLRNHKLNFNYSTIKILFDNT